VRIETDPLTGGPAPYDPGVEYDTLNPDTGCPADPALADQRARWLPNKTAVVQARLLLDANPNAAIVMIPMIQPGKQRGWWTVGQEVVTVPGVFFLATDTSEPRDGVLSYDHARHYCEILAGQVLADEWRRRSDADPSRLHAPGTTAHAVVSKVTGSVAVFEGI
jgi:hypothetical protein